MALQKFIKVGNSVAVTIPKDEFKLLQLKVGSPVWVNFDEEERVFKVDPKPGKKAVKKSSTAKLDPEFTAWANSFIKENIELFKELAHK